TVRFFDNRRVRQGLTILMLFGALACIFPPMHPAFYWWASHAVYVALGYLLAGLFFLIIDNPRLMFVCLGCSAAICFFKNELGDHPLDPEHTGISHYAPESAAGNTAPADYTCIHICPTDEPLQTDQ
ncbi:MAG: hypothetical protein KDC70_08245, partial [Saprospiraceae bacterium]|nr:hypothetical protein [Saprospiraceae bacterium]